MALINDLNNREFDKFREDKSGKPAIAIVIDELEPTNSLNNNASNVYEYTSGNLTKITKTIGDTSYEKTFTYTGDELTGSSAWSEI
jgi:hypothetical protein